MNINLTTIGLINSWMMKPRLYENGFSTNPVSLHKSTRDIMSCQSTLEYTEVLSTNTEVATCKICQCDKYNFTINTQQVLVDCLGNRYDLKIY